MSKNIQSIYGEQPCMFPPSLAVVVGVNAAIILQKIEFLCRESKSGRIIEDERWIWNTYEQWRDEHFPFWSTSTIKENILFLERQGYLLSCQPDGAMSRKKYYRVSTAFKRHATLEEAERLLTEAKEKGRDGPEQRKIADRRTIIAVPKQTRLSD